MKRWARGFYFILVISLVTAGCKGGGSSATSTIAISPTSLTILVNGLFQFAASVSTTTDPVIWSVNGTTGGNATVGTITTGGVYQAPATVPASTTITVTATQGSASASATVTLDSGVRVSVTPTAATVGTGEVLLFFPTVTGVPTGSDSSAKWSITPATAGTIDPVTGIYTAGSTAATGTITATSNFDTTKTATAAVTVVAAADPTVTSIGPPIGPTIGAAGAAFQDIYLTGTNFLSTTTVFINGVVPPKLTTAVGSNTTLLVRVPDSSLAAAGTLTFTVARQGGAPQACAVPAQCQLALSQVRPAIVGTSPDSIPIPTGGASATFNVNGGYFGAAPTPTIPAVKAEFGGAAKTPTLNSPRQLGVTINAADVSGGGLYPVAVQNQAPDTQRAVTNLAVQPALAGTPVPPTVTVGTAPAAVAINAATGIAVVANQGSNNITLIDLTTPSPTTLGYICSGVSGAGLTATSTSCAAASAPVSVTVDDLHNKALVANSGTQNVAVVDLAGPSVTALINVSGVPAAVGINPQTRLGIVAYRTAGYASLLDLSQPTPAVTGIVTLSNGPNPRIAVSPKLNWALVTPGGFGSLTIVDLAKTTSISGVTAVRAAGTVTATAPSAHGLQVGEAVLVTGMTDTLFNGVFTVLSVPSSLTFTYSQAGASASSTGKITHALPVATLAVNQSISGVAFNDETYKAVLVDNAVGFATILNALDQSSSVVSLPQVAGNVAAAFNPLTNVAVVVNQTVSQAAVIDPTGGTAAGQFSVVNHPVDVAIDPGTNRAVIVNQLDNSVTIASLGAIRSPQILQISNQSSSVSNPSQITLADVTVNSTLTTAAVYTDQTLTIVGKGLAGAVARLDGDSTGVQVQTATDRVLTVKVLGSRLQTGGPRRYALDVTNGGTVSNAASFTVVQSVDVTGTGCSAPLGVAIDPQHNLAVVGDPGCSNVSLINLATGTGQTVAVGTNPVGIAVLPQSGLAVVANSGSNTASVVDVVGATVVATVNTDVSPTGVAIDPLLGKAVIAATGANVADVFTVSATPGAVSSIAVQQRPVAVAIDPVRHLAAIGNTSSNSVSLVDLQQNISTAAVGVTSPAGIVFDPLSRTFLVAGSLTNQVQVLDPATQTSTFIRVGVNPTSIANNFASSTVVTTNNLSNSMTVVDFLDQRVRAVLPVTPSNGFSIDIHPFTNLAVIADSTNNRVLLFPLPR